MRNSLPLLIFLIHALNFYHSKCVYTGLNDCRMNICIWTATLKRPLYLFDFNLFACARWTQTECNVVIYAIRLLQDRFVCNVLCEIVTIVISDYHSLEFDIHKRNFVITIMTMAYKSMYITGNEVLKWKFCNRLD